MRPPKNEIMKPSEMALMESENRIGNRLYSRTADGAEVVTAIVSRLAMDLANRPRKISLQDPNEIEDVAIAYVNACAEAGTLPSKVGLCRAMGYSRQGVDYFLNHHGEEPGAEQLRQIFDGFADVMNTAALTGACHPIVGIFTLKSQAGWRDTVSIETDVKRDPLGERKSTAEIMAKYADILPDD